MKYPPAWLLATAALIAASCASPRPRPLYEGEARPAGEVARLQVPSAIELVSVDGRELKNVTVGSAFGLRSEFELLPGTHEVVACYIAMYSLPERDDHVAFRSPPMALTFRAEAGRVYRLAYRTGAAVEDWAAPQPDVHMPVEIWIEESGRTDDGATIRQEPHSADAPPPPATLEAPPAESPAPAAQTHRASELKRLWRESSEEERTEFLRTLAREPPADAD